jgi:hypothetical protein
MNQPSTDSSISSSNGASADAISRRAYEIWEREGRPEGCDLRHWLQAEQELGVSRADRADNGKRPESAVRSDSSSSRNTNTDTRQLQGTRSGPPPGRDTKRPTSGSFTGEKNGTTGMSGQNAAKRKPAAAPVL